jgi:hypothetical protein
MAQVTIPITYRPGYLGFAQWDDFCKKVRELHQSRKITSIRCVSPKQYAVVTFSEPESAVTEHSA